MKGQPEDAFHWEDDTWYTDIQGKCSASRRKNKCRVLKTRAGFSDNKEEGDQSGWNGVSEKKRAREEDGSWITWGLQAIVRTFLFLSKTGSH